jgi:D-amino peptidase
VSNAVKVFISVDMEGICGVTSLKQINSNNPEYGQARLWMTDDVNAAVEGAIEAGVGEVVVRDAHGPAINILPDRLHPSARLMAGWAPVLDMMQGLDGTFDLAFLIGYHPGPPAADGVLSHTYSMEQVREVIINGLSAGETLINAIQAGVHGVPIGLVTGEHALQDEISPALPEVEFVATKTGFGYQSALLESMSRCRDQIRQAAARAVKRCLDGTAFPVYRPSLPIEARIDFHKAEGCAASRLVPGMVPIDSRSALLSADSAEELIRRFQLLMQVFYGLK